MNFRKPGWLEKYLAFRTTTPFAETLPSAPAGSPRDVRSADAQDRAIYYFLQPTGLLYGFPVGMPFPALQYPWEKYLDSSERVLLIFLETLFACLVAERHCLLERRGAARTGVRRAARVVGWHFAHRPGWPDSDLWRMLSALLPVLFPRGPLRKSERAFGHAISQGTRRLKLPGDYYNSFLFLDLYYCVQRQRRLMQAPNRRAAIAAELHAEQAAVRRAVLELQIVAAHASSGVDPAERRLFERFLLASGLPEAARKELRRSLKMGLAPDQVTIPPLPWLLRRYCLESVLITLLADGVVDALERAFVERIAERLGLGQDELNQSQTAVEAFVLNQESTLHIVKARPQMLQLRDRLVERITILLRKNLDHIVQEVRETHELYTLLMKSTHAPLTPEEKRKVREQLVDIMKTVPTLAIVTVPGGTIWLAILIKLLPFNLLPSSFDD
jgi:hypothetical protein